MILLLCSMAFGSEINTAITTFNQLASFEIPLLSAKELNNIAAGKMVKRIEDDENKKPTRAIAYILSSHSQEDLWLASQDPHLVTQSKVEYHLLERKNKDQTLWYAFMDLPWPFDDRHWATNAWNNHTLAEKTNGKMWEHGWVIEKDWHKHKPRIEQAVAQKLLGDVTTKMISEAIYIPESQGAWVIIRLSNATLMVYHATASAGGHVPVDILLSFLLRSLDDLFNGVEENAKKTIKSHYSQGHHPIYDGHGNAIPYRSQ